MTDKKKELNKALAEIGNNINTQDNRITGHPIFVVEQQVRDFGYESDFASDYVWIDYDNDHYEADEDEHKGLDIIYKDTGRSPNAWEMAFYKERWEFVTACFTEKGCEDYLAIDGHNLGKTRIYVHSGYRNYEWQQIREALGVGVVVENLALRTAQLQQAVNDAVRFGVYEDDAKHWQRLIELSDEIF